MISVIIPIYNVEKYLRRALDSIAAQTYTDWETILVDDGSTDGSGSIAKEYAESDQRFRLFNQENQGVGVARNFAVSKANGEWLMFLDSDDFLHPKAMELCINTVLRDQSDMVAFTYNRRYRAMAMARHVMHLPESIVHYPQITSNDSHITTNIYHYATEHSRRTPVPGIDPHFVVRHCQVWRCLYRATLIRDIIFPSGIAYEDFPWWSEVMLRMPKTSILNLPLYYYSPNLKSTILSSDKAYKIHSLETAISMAKDSYKDAPPEIKRLWEENFLKPFEKKLRKKRHN